MAVQVRQSISQAKPATARGFSISATVRAPICPCWRVATAIPVTQNIGVEFAYILQRFGFEINWFTGGPLLSRAGFSAQAMNVLRQSLHKHGIISRMGRPKLKSLSDDGVLLATESEEVLVD